MKFPRFDDISADIAIFCIAVGFIAAMVAAAIAAAFAVVIALMWWPLTICFTVLGYVVDKAIDFLTEKRL